MQVQILSPALKMEGSQPSDPRRFAGGSAVENRHNRVVKGRLIQRRFAFADRLFVYTPEVYSEKEFRLSLGGEPVFLASNPVLGVCGSSLIFHG